MTSRRPLLMKLAMGAHRGFLVPGSDGWIFWQFPTPLDLRLRLRADLSVGALHLEDPATGGVSASTLRTIPLGLLAKVLGAPGYRAVIAAAKTDPKASPLDPCSVPYEDAVAVAGRLQTLLLPDDVLVPVTGGLRTDEFYAGVSNAYARAVVNYDQPVARMAHVNGVPESTINGWLQEARRRSAREHAKSSAALL